MKRFFLKTYDKLLIALLGIFPFITGCDEPRVEYGSPFANYDLNGTVKDSISSSPIPGIKLVLKSNKGYGFDTTETGSDGKYSFVFNDTPDNVKVFKIEAVDKDGTLNGGEFTSKELEIEILESEYIKDTEELLWYVGYAHKTRDFKLKKK